VLEFIADINSTAPNSWMVLLMDWAVVGGFCLALAGSVIMVIGFVVTLKVTQHDHARRLSHLEEIQAEASRNMQDMQRGITALLERTNHLAVRQGAPRF